MFLHHHAQPLERLLQLLVAAQTKPVDDLGDGKEQAVEEKVPPDPLEDAAAPLGEDADEAAEGSRVNMLHVRYCHPC